MKFLGLGLCVAVSLGATTTFAQTPAPEGANEAEVTEAAPQPDSQPAAPVAPASQPATPATPAATPEPQPPPSTPPPPIVYSTSASSDPVADRGSAESGATAADKSPYPGWQLVFGARGNFVAQQGYDPFAENDSFMQFSVGASRTVFSQDAFSIAGALYYDVGVQDGTARGETTQLTAHRLSLGPEARLHLIPEAYVFARVSPAVLRTLASIEETSSGTTLHARAWSFGVDAFAGGAWEFWDVSNSVGDLRFWLLAEGGYGWASASDLEFSADEDDDNAPRRLAALDLGSLALRGPAFRIMVGATF